MLRNTLVALAGRSSPNAGHGQLRSLLREPRRNRLSGRLQSQGTVRGPTELQETVA